MATIGMDPNISQGISQLGGAMLKLPSIHQEAAKQAAAQANADRLYQLQYERNNAQIPLIRAQTDWYNARTNNETSKGIAGELFPSLVNNIFDTIPATAGDPGSPAGWAPPSGGWSSPDQPMSSLAAYPGRPAIAAQPARTAITSDASKLAAFIAGANAAGYNPQTNVNAVRQLLGTQAMTAGTPENPNIPFQGYQGLGMNLITPGSFDTNTATGVEDRDAMIANAHANAMELARAKGELANAGSLATQGLRNEGAMARLQAKGEQVTPGKGPKISFSEDKAAQEKALVLINEFVNNALKGASDSDAASLRDAFMGSDKGKEIMTELSKVIREKFAATKNVVEAEEAGKAYLSGLKNVDIGTVKHLISDNEVYVANKDISSVGGTGTKISPSGSTQTPAQAIAQPQMPIKPAEQTAPPVSTTEQKPVSSEQTLVGPKTEVAKESPVAESPAAAVAPAVAPVQPKQEEPAPMKQSTGEAAPTVEPAKVEPKNNSPAAAVAEQPKSEDKTGANLSSLTSNNPFKGTGTIEEQLPEQIGSPSGAGAPSTEKTPFEKQYVALMTRKAQLSRSLFRGPVNMSLTAGIGQDERGVLVDMTKLESPTSPRFATIGGKDEVTKELLDIDARLKKMMRNPISRISPSAAYLDDLTIDGAGKYYVEDASKVDADKRPFVIDKKEIMFLLQSPTVIRNSDGTPRAVYKTNDGRYIDEGIVFSNFDKHHKKLSDYFIQEGMLDMKPGDSLARKLFQLKVSADAEILAYNRAKGDSSWLKQMGQGLGLPGVQSLMPNGTGFGQSRNMMRYGSPEYLKQHPIPDVPGQ
jgi:hypothetical protein